MNALRPPRRSRVTRRRSWFPRGRSDYYSTSAGEDDTIILGDEQTARLERYSFDFRCRHIDSWRRSDFLTQDRFYWGSLTGVGNVYVQVAIEVFCALASAKVYTSKVPVTACNPLCDRVLSLYEMPGVSIGAVLRDNGREFSGQPETHPYELRLAMEGTDHRTTRASSPRTNGSVKRMNWTLLGECFCVGGRTTWYVEVKEIQRDIDRFLAYYNVHRTHLGYRLKGRTPTQALCEALGQGATLTSPQLSTELGEELGKEGETA